MEQESGGFSAEFTATVWRHSGAAAWHFVTVPEQVSDDIAELSGDHSRGFGSVPVAASVGRTRWRTSVFPDRGRGAYVLPMKQAVLRAEGLRAGETVQLTIRVEGGPDAQPTEAPRDDPVARRRVRRAGRIAGGAL